jgi:arylsulfatase A-like enzyme
MFTGRYELNHGVIGDTLVLSRAVPTLGEILKANGYLTGAFVSGPYLGGHYGYARGMDAYLDLSAGHEKRHDAGSMVLAPAVTEHALAWLDVNSQSPFFLFLHYFDIHYDYVPPPPYDTMFDPSYSGSIDGRRFLERPDIDADMNPRDLQHILALYDGEIRFTDDQVGRVLTKLDDLGISDDTLVLIVSDHGDEFFEHGKKGHQQTLYREVLDIVFIVRMPHGLYAGRKIDVPVSLIDVMPTILDVLGIPIPIGVDGKSLRQLLAQPASFARESVYAELYYKGALNVQVARRTADSKVIQHFNRITHPRRPSLEYYDLNSDPTERQNAARFRPAELMSALDAMARSLEERWRVRRARADTTHEEDLRITLDEETLRRLESLGYVED